jgi:hypothetical protein
MITMHMGIDHEANLTIVQPADCSKDFVRKRRKLIVDHDYAILAYREPDVSTGTLQIVESAGHMVRNYLDIAEILLREDWLCQQ